MPSLTFDPTGDQPSPEQVAAETAALEQGEKIVQAQQEDKERALSQVDSETEDVSLIGGKFKSQDDLLQAYNELQKKLGKSDPEDSEDATEEPTEASDKDESPPDEGVDYMFKLNDVFQETGKISEDDIENLSSMDSKELIATYLKYQTAATAKAGEKAVEASVINDIKAGVGGDEAYSEMTAWAAENLNESEISDYNNVTSSGNPAAIKFAVEALNNRFRSQVGYEAPLVTGRKASSGVKPYRSQAELARDIGDPKYSSDPAFRQDVEARLSKSKDLL